jgi:poly(rC)-binding protein 2/3/4
MAPPELLPRGPAFPNLNPLYGMSNIGGGAPPMPGFGMDSSAPWSMGSHPPTGHFPLHGPNPLERRDPGREEDFAVRMLCPNERIGLVIGKGGNAIRHLREITNSRIKVEDAVPESDERVIAISATEVFIT